MRSNALWLAFLFPGLFIGTQYYLRALPSDQSTVGVQSVVEQSVAAPADGGPQALEGYVRLNHDRGQVQLAIGTIGNVEVSGSGPITLVRSLQGGGVIRTQAPIAHWTSLYLDVPTNGRVTRLDYITFSNGWSIRPQGAQLLICSPQAVCRDMP